MKKFIYAFILMIVLGSFVSVNFAQAVLKNRPSVLKGSVAVGEKSSTTPRMTPAGSPNANRIKMMEENKLKVQEKRVERVRFYFGHMIRKIQAAINRESKLADRIESHLNKFEAAGKNVSVQKAKLAEARLSIQDAQKFLDDAKAKIENVLKSENMQQAFKDVRALIKSAVDKVKLAHKKLVEVITSLKGMSIKKSPNPVISPTEKSPNPIKSSTSNSAQ